MIFNYFFQTSYNPLEINLKKNHAGNEMYKFGVMVAQGLVEYVVQ